MRWRKDFRPGIRYHGQINVGAVHDMTPSPIINVRPYQPHNVAAWYTSARFRLFLYVFFFTNLAVVKYTDFLRSSDASSGLGIVRCVRVFTQWWEELPNRPSHFLSGIARKFQPFKKFESSVDDIDYMTRADIAADRARESALNANLFHRGADDSRAFTVPRPAIGTPERKMLDELAGWSMTGPYAGPLSPSTHVPASSWGAAGMGMKKE